ncbi:MAG: hypothetical protein GVY29_05500, partial [Spirochaetes bacterium]|nr:hypothetical protein [Spirochaetota bacterium]
MSEQFFLQPVLNSPYERPGRHWEIENEQPTGRIVESRRPADFMTPIPQAKHRRRGGADGEGQGELDMGPADGAAAGSDA